MRSEDGSSLPMGRKLHRILQLQVLHEYAFPLLVHLPAYRVDFERHHRSHAQPPRKLRLQSELLRDDWLHLGSGAGLHHYGLHDFPLLPDLVRVHHN